MHSQQPPSPYQQAPSQREAAQEPPALEQQPFQQPPVQPQPTQQPFQEQVTQRPPAQQPLGEPMAPQQPAQQSLQQPPQQQPVQQSMSGQMGQASPSQQPFEAAYQSAQPSQPGQGTAPGPATMQPTQPQGSAPTGQQGAGQPLAQTPAQPPVGQGGPVGQQLQRPGEGTQGTFVPQVDVWDSPEEFTVVADLPGCGPDDVELQATDNSLHIIATRKPEEFEEESRVYQRERLDQAERRIELPGNVDVENAEATCENGVCRITLPKREDEQQKRIGIH